MNNKEIAMMFDQVADMLAIRGDNFRRVLAYRKASEQIQGLEKGLDTIAKAGELTKIPNIGKTLAEKIEEMLITGDLQFFHKVAKDIPPTLLDLLKIEGLGPKKVKLFYDKLNIQTLDELQAASIAGKLRDLPGMGAKSEAKVLAGIERLQQYKPSRTPIGAAWQIAHKILTRLEKLPSVEQTTFGGSLRRRKETIGDIDLLVASDETKTIMDYFVQMEEVHEIVGRGPTKVRVILQNGMGVDLRILPATNWGTLLSYFTGSQAHNVRLRELAQKQGMSLNEYSFTSDGNSEIICSTEEGVYATLGLPYIPPVLREDQGEIEAAQQGNLPALVQTNDILADLHIHTTWSDGFLTIKEIANLAQKQGLKYIAITDHSVSLGIANGLSVERLQKQAEEVKAINKTMGDDLYILHGTEMEIRADGSLDFPDDVLANLDFVIASLHVSLQQPRQQITERLLNAIDNPHVDMIAHPTGRLIPDRAGADLDIERIFMTASRTGTILEINANPNRLDLKDIHVRRALQLGVKLAINTDTHHPDQFAHRHFGIATAQRGWATAEQIVNCWSLEKFLAFIN